MRKNPSPKLCRSGNTLYRPILISENHTCAVAPSSGSPANSSSTPATTGKNTRGSILCRDEVSRGKAPPLSNRLSHRRRPMSRLRAVPWTRRVTQATWPVGGPAEICNLSLNLSTGYPISSANTQLPRSTGSRSFHSRNSDPHTGRFKPGPALKPAGAMSDFARGVIGVLAVGMIAGVGALLLIPQPSPSAMRFSEPPARSCSQQAWPATDRICQKWTAPRRSDAHGTADAPPPSANAQPAVQSEPGSSRSRRRRR